MPISFSITGRSGEKITRDVKLKKKRPVRKKSPLNADERGCLAMLFRKEFY